MTLYFPDISAFQAGIDLNGALAVIIKATEGTDWENTDYGRAKANAAGHRAYIAAYHFLHHGHAAAQATWAHKRVGGTPLAIDCEPNEAAGSHPNVADVETFITAYRKAGGVTHLLYLPHWWWDALGRPSLKPLADRGMALWSSAYTLYSDADDATGWQGYGGIVPQLWQYTDRLHFNGHDIDFSAFRGRHAGDQSGAAVKACLDEFKSVAATGKLPPRKPPVAPPDPPQARQASGNESLRHAVHREGTTVARALWLMARAHEDGNFGHPLQAIYVARGDYNAIMPKGMTYWVG